VRGQNEPDQHRTIPENNKGQIPTKTPSQSPSTAISAGAGNTTE
ncbi:hypothetical protein A2U01_0051807, partial [Trifolium medium]|nr:hypothetical protein [Trifolium medium]